MATRTLRFFSAFLLLSFFSTAFSQDFPTISDFDFAFIQTEVQIVDTIQQLSAYATEYYVGQQGALKLYFQGDQQLIYFDNSTYQVTEINGPNCTVWDADISDEFYREIFFGWLNKNPIVIGPTAPLWYAQTRRIDIKSAGTEVVRSINCDKFILPVKNNVDDLTYEYYFAKSDWTTPYQYRNLRIPVRIRISGKSSRYSANPQTPVSVDQINDFAYFKPSFDDFNDLLPPVGVGCQLRPKTDFMPPIPDAFQYAAEVVDLLDVTAKDNVEIQFQRTWFDSKRLLARRDGYSRKKGFASNLFDFNTGTLYKIFNDGTCEMATLRDTDFQKYDYGMTSRIKTAKEVLNLDGDFYDMGKREIRGIECDTFESVEFDKHFRGKKYYKLVVTAYFTESETEVGINAEMESRIPVYYIITGYETPNNKTMQLQYNIFGFDDVIWPEIYASFRLERCYTKPGSKAYFVLILPVSAKVAAQMEDKDEMVITNLRSAIARHARVPEMRIPYLKADYKPTGVYVTGVMVERPPALLQFYNIDSGPTITNDPDLKIATEAETTEECSYACIDEPDFLCKGFYFCGKVCFLKSTDPFDVEDSGKSKNLGECTEYMRAEIESTNFRQSYLPDALGYLDEAVEAGNLTVAFTIPDGEEVVTVKDLVIGEGPYTGTDSGDTPFTLNDELRKLDSSLETVTSVEYAVSLHDCYKRCKELGSQCSSFSFCPDAKSDNKECLVSSELIIKGVTKDTDLIPDKNCNIYNLKFSDYFIPYSEKVSLLAGDKTIRSVPALEKCAESCRLETDFKCRGFEYCRNKKVCTLHKKHILDLKPGESGSPDSTECIHYAARFIADYADMGGVLIDDNSNVRYGTSLEECARMCSEELKSDCKSFNYCQQNDKNPDTTCALSTKLLRQDGVTTTQKTGCMHYEKRDSIHDWDNSKAAKLATGYTKKQFTGLVVGMIFLGIIVGALGFIFYSYMRSRSSGEGMAVRFMKNES